MDQQKQSHIQSITTTKKTKPNETTEQLIAKFLSTLTSKENEKPTDNESE